MKTLGNAFGNLHIFYRLFDSFDIERMTMKEKRIFRDKNKIRFSKTFFLPSNLTDIIISFSTLGNSFVNRIK